MNDDIAYEILRKIKYQEEKLSQNRGRLLEALRGSQEVGIYPYVFFHSKPPSLPGVTILGAITSERLRIRVAGYLEDKEGMCLWSPQEMLYGREETRYLVIVKLGNHYIQRFIQRCPPSCRLLGNPDEACILDLHSTTTGFSDLQKLGEYRDLIMEVLMEETGNTEEHIGKILNYEDRISICKTRWGYGIYQVVLMTQNILRVHMITWLSPSMMSQKQKDMISMII